MSRLFLFDEATKLIEEFERHQSPCLHMYSKFFLLILFLFESVFLVSLLSSVRNQNNVPLARQITQRIQELFHGVDKDAISASVLLINTLASSGNLDEASQMRWNLSQSGEKKQMGLSWTEINDEIVVDKMFLC